MLGFIHQKAEQSRQIFSVGFPLLDVNTLKAGYCFIHSQHKAQTLNSIKVGE